MIKTSKLGTAIHLAKGMMEEGTPFLFWVGEGGKYIFDDIPQQRSEMSDLLPALCKMGLTSLVDVEGNEGRD